MELQKDKPTNAFEKYIDHIALMQNEVYFYMPRTRMEGLHYEVKLETYYDEMCLRAAICNKTAKDISEILPFNEVKKQYNSAILRLAKEDLDLIEFRKKKDKLDKQLLTYAKFEYCKQNYLSELNLNNDIVIAGILLTILDKINKRTKMKIWECLVYLEQKSINTLKRHCLKKMNLTLNRHTIKNQFQRWLKGYLMQ